MEITYPILIEWATFRPLLLGYFSTVVNNGEYCAQLGVRQSMGAVGTSADNALAESFNAILKREVLLIGNSLKVQSAAGRRSSGGARATTRAGGTPGATF